MTKKALLLVDLQNDFMPGGALGVPRGHEVIALANQLQEKFELIIATQDWHPKKHGSFHTLWPQHCVQHSRGAALVDTLHQHKISKIIFKGTHPDIDSYSSFFDNEHQQSTELHQYLQQKKVTELYIVGLATEYCVKFSALDAIALGYKTHVIEDACRGIDLNAGDIKKALKEMQKKGVKIIQSAHVLQDKKPAKRRKSP